MTHPFDRHLQRAAAMEQHRGWALADGPLPALYLSHGAPPTFEDEPWMDQLHSWARRLPKPTAILIVSAHWESAPLALSGSAAHGLQFMTRAMLAGHVPGWSSDFDAWAADALARGDVDELAAFRTGRRACRTHTRRSSTSRRCSSPSARRRTRPAR